MTVGRPQRAAKPPKFRYRLSGMKKTSKMKKGRYSEFRSIVVTQIATIIDALEKLEMLLDAYEEEFKSFQRTINKLKKVKK